MKLTYTNPVYPGYFADPFVLKVGGEYYAYGTGDVPRREGKVFDILRSRDLVYWEHLGGALDPLPQLSGAPHWAPEVAERDGRFYMYYSAATGGTDDTHRLRVAIADDPGGPFKDSGRTLMPEIGFSIDASPFRDPRDGRWYLFFAKDFFDERVGTGTAVVPLKDDLMTPAEEPRVVIRASADWQIYQRDRGIYGKCWSAWHTVEGPSVVEHGGKYYCLYSGGCWFTPAYGVSFGVADHPMGPYRDEASAQGPSVLAGIEGQVLGPGHNSVTVGPDGKTPFIVYHAWDAEKTARRMCIDPLRFTPQGPRCDGPTFTRQEINLGA